MSYEEMISQVLAYCKDNDDDFIQAIEDLDGWNGYLGDDRCYPMWELDDIYGGMKLTEFLDLITNEFNTSDSYFYHSIYGIKSCEYIDYSAYCDEAFVKDLYAFWSEGRLSYVPDGITDIFNKYEETQDEEKE